jgi:hypothetical protein
MFISSERWLQAQLGLLDATRPFPRQSPKAYGLENCVDAVLKAKLDLYIPSRPILSIVLLRLETLFDQISIMPVKSRFTRLDAFTKTVEDARVRTTSGGIVTLSSLLLIMWLVWGEYADYRRVVVHPELIVDKGRGEKMEIHMNISFPRVPCELLTLDVMDVSGEIQTGVMHGVNKVRLAPESDGGHAIDSKALDL